MKIGILVFILIMSQTIIGMFIEYFIGMGYSVVFIIGCILADIIACFANDVYGEKK